MDRSDYNQQWRATNRERVRESRRAYYEAHKDEEKSRAIEWQKSHRERQRLLWKVSKANQRYPGTLTIEDLLEVIERCGSRCHWCGKGNLRARQFTLEHMFPINDRRYLTIACLSCNAARIHKTDGRRSTAQERREAKSAWARKYYEENREEIITNSQAWFQANREHRRKYMREYMRRKRAGRRREEQ